LDTSGNFLGRILPKNVAPSFFTKKYTDSISMLANNQGFFVEFFPYLPLSVSLKFLAKIPHSKKGVPPPRGVSNNLSPFGNLTTTTKRNA
jgi:hypothetical protein